MPVSSHGHRYRKMTRSREFFEIGEPFRYSPLTDISKPDTVTVLVPVVLEKYRNVEAGMYRSDWEYCKECDLEKYCYPWRMPDNLDANGDSFIPDCSKYTRKDGKDVVFKEYKI